jgi:hypothetical protein
MVYFGTVQGHESLVPGISIYCESKLSWVNIPETIRNFRRAPTTDA